LVGVGFPEDPTKVRFIVDGVAQKVTFSSNNLIKITLSGFLDSMSKKIKFYLQDGTPDGADQLTEIGIRLIPYLQSISPNSGSYAGTTITAKLMGVGINTAAVNFALSTNAIPICSSVKIPSYGVVECTTKPGT